jgi:predicted GIY-YIG superfamily endonuclease
MPFQNHGNRSFTMTSVDKNAPAASGVYGLADARQWIYVGETANIQAELFQHLQHPGAFLTEHAPSGFTFELSAAEHRHERQSRLVLELGPIGNRPEREEVA